jgi:hypothetical protein
MKFKNCWHSARCNIFQSNAEYQMIRYYYIFRHYIVQQYLPKRKFLEQSSVNIWSYIWRPRHINSEDFASGPSWQNIVKFTWNKLRCRVNEKAWNFSRVTQSIVNLISDRPKGQRGGLSEHFQDPFRTLYERVSSFSWGSNCYNQWSPYQGKLLMSISSLAIYPPSYLSFSLRSCWGSRRGRSRRRSCPTIKVAAVGITRKWNVKKSNILWLSTNMVAKSGWGAFKILALKKEVLGRN